MVKLKNNNGVVKHFVLLLTFTAFISCAEKKYAVTKIEGKEIGITDKHSEVASIENFIKPYRDRIDADLNTVLGNAPETIDKSGEWQTPMGNFLADITFEKSDKVFQLREKKAVDICLLNHGGIRSIIPKGTITARTAYEVMPFENSVIVIGLKGEQILEIVNYIISEKKPHPLKGLTFTVSSPANSPKDFLVQGKPIEMDKIYYVVTSDYLSNGGDNMLFFRKGVEKYDLDYKLRNIIIDYFKENKTIIANKDIRITKE
jgi:2',3'-cyclic-nucleotide 2'-phosphodiesterase (5'-nucleotidase family)